MQKKVGRPIENTKPMKLLNVQIEEKTHDQLKAVAFNEGVTLADLIRKEVTKIAKKAAKD